MLRPPRIISTDRFHLRELNQAVLSQFDIVVIVDGAATHLTSDSPGLLSDPGEIDALKEYYYNGGPFVIGAAGHQKGTTDALRGGASDILNKLGLGLTLPEDAFRANGGVIRKKSGSSMRVSLGAGGGGLQYSTDTSFYVHRFHLRKLFGENNVRECRVEGLTNGSLTESSGQTVVSGSGKVSGTWHNLIIHTNYTRSNTAQDGTEDVRHLVFEPLVQPTGAAGYEGTVPGRVVLEAGFRNWFTFDDAFEQTDQLRMLAAAIVWACRDIPPEDVLIYNLAGRAQTSGTENDIQSGITGALAGVAQELTTFLSLPIESLGDGT